jgi:hypothetical protein
MKKFLIVIIVLSIMTAGCATNQPAEVNGSETAPPTPTETPAPTAPPATAVPTEVIVTPTGESLSGVVTWGGEPVAGARVDMRAPDWQTSGQDDAYAAVTTGAAGQFLFANPPVGEFALVAFWPDGEMTHGATPVVTIEPEQSLTDQEIKIERGLVLIEPDFSEPAETLPTFTWEPLPEDAIYHVLIIDAGTTEPIFDLETAANTVTLVDQLQPDHAYSVVIMALHPDRTDSLANVQVDFVTQDTLSVPPPLALPPTCVQPGLPTYIDRDLGICYAFPQRFSVGGSEDGGGNIVGTPMSGTLEPLFASLNIEYTPTGDQERAAFIEAYLEGFADTEFEIRRLPTALAGQAAELLEPVPGDLSSRQVIADHRQDGIITLSFAPSFRERAAGTLVTPQRRAQIEADLLFETVMASFDFLSPRGIAPEDAILIPESCVSGDQAVFVDPEGGYCLAFPARFSVQTAPGGGPMLVGPPLDQSLSPVRALFTLILEEITTERTLDDIVTDYAGSDVNWNETTVAGLPAIMVDGVPSRGTAKNLFVPIGDIVYHFFFQPDLERAPRAADDVEALYTAVTASFSLLEVPVAP